MHGGALGVDHFHCYIERVVDCCRVVDSSNYRDLCRSPGRRELCLHMHRRQRDGGNVDQIHMAIHSAVEAEVTEVRGLRSRSRELSQRLEGDRRLHCGCTGALEPCHAPFVPVQRNRQDPRRRVRCAGEVWHSPHRIRRAWAIQTERRAAGCAEHIGTKTMPGMRLLCPTSWSIRRCSSSRMWA